MGKPLNQAKNKGTGQISLDSLSITALTEEIISQHTAAYFTIDPLGYHYIFPELLELNHGVFINSRNAQNFPPVTVLQQNGTLVLTCGCKPEHQQLCEHQAVALSAILRKEDFRVFYDTRFRHEKLKKFAADYGLEQEPDLDKFFKITYEDRKLQISSKSPELLRITKESLDQLNSIIVEVALPVVAVDQSTVIVLRKHKYYKYLLIELYQGQQTKEGKVKNPLNLVPPLDGIWNTDDGEQLKFYTAVHKFQNHQHKNVSEADIQALKAVVKNPLAYDFYYHDAEVSENVTASSIIPINVKLLEDESKLTVDSKEQFFELSGSVEINKQAYSLKDLEVWFTYFIRAGETLYLANNLQTLNVIGLLSKKEENLLVHVSKFQEFKNKLLSKLEERIQVDYKHIPEATPVQLVQEGFDKQNEKIIYLSDFGSHVMIIPVMRYGEVEISIRTKKMIYTADAKGKELMVQRNEKEENDFTALLIKQHPDFHEQLTDPLHYFYLQKKHFLTENWFLNVFEEWQRHNITILGFNELEGNKLICTRLKFRSKLSAVSTGLTAISMRALVKQKQL